MAVCDPVKANADAMAERLDVQAFYSVRELVNARPMEAALIVAPIETHYPLSCFLMQHGIHCHVEETMRAHFFNFPEGKLVVDMAANIRGLLGRYPRPGYTEVDGTRGAIVRTASHQSDPARIWHGEAEVRYCSDEALGSKAIADRIFPVEHVTEDGCWVRTYVELPTGRVEYVNPYHLTDAKAIHARDYYTAATMDHVVDFAGAVRGVRDSEYTDADALMAMMMEVATRESALAGGALVQLPLTGVLESEELVRRRHWEKNGVDPMDVEAMLEYRTSPVHFN